jgi:1-acyl-sn-glycerol-3-phosphate acyltransferase
MILAALRTFLSLVVLSVYVLLLAPPLALWTFVSGRQKEIYAASKLALKLAFALAGIRIELEGREHIQHHRAAVYAANHSSNIDPPGVFRALSMLFPKLRILYKAELRRIPVLVWVFDAGGFVPVERNNREQSLPAVDRAARALAAGFSFVIFPEGTRSRTGALLPFKKGGFLMAIAAQVPVVPVAVSGGRDAMRAGSPLIWPVTVRVQLCPPIETAGLTQADRDALAQRTRAAIAERLATKGT